MQGRHKPKKQALRKRKITMVHRHILVEKICPDMKNLLKYVETTRYRLNSEVRILFVSNKILAYCNKNNSGLIVKIKNVNVSTKTPEYRLESRIIDEYIHFNFELPWMIIDKIGIGYKEDVLFNLILGYAHRISKANTLEDANDLMDEANAKEKEFRLKVFDKIHSGVKENS